jgi:adenylate cyclase
MKRKRTDPGAEAAPAASSRRLSPARLAAEAGVDVGYVRRLVEAGALHPDGDGRHAPEDVLQIRLIQALAEGGVGLDDVVWAIREGRLPVDRAVQSWGLSEWSGRTFDEFAGSLGEKGVLLPAVYAAFGLAVPTPRTITRRDEEAVLAAFLELWGMVDDRADAYVRAARIVGEGVRRIEIGILDLFDELGGPPPTRLQRGLSPEEALRPSQLLMPLMEQTLLWLHARHTEHEVFERIVAAVERALMRAGRKERRPSEPPAVAFVDLTGYTTLAATAGDEPAARAATMLHALALEAARDHQGRVVKLLGDGVVLRYPSTGAAVASVGALMARIGDARLPSAHAGIAAGAIVSRDGDVYGHTVNLAARIASHASAGELLVLADVADAAARAGFEWEDAGEAALKGLDEPVRLARVISPALSRPRSGGTRP